MCHVTLVVEFLLLDLMTGVQFPVSPSNVRVSYCARHKIRPSHSGNEPWSLDPKARILPLDQLVKFLFQLISVNFQVYLNDAQWCSNQDKGDRLWKSYRILRFLIILKHFLNCNTCNMLPDCKFYLCSDFLSLLSKWFYRKQTILWALYDNNLQRVRQ